MRSENYVDVKCTVWKRYHFENDTDMEKVKSMIDKDGNINNILDEELGFSECETLFDTETELDPEDNKGYSTIEVYKGEEVIWENSIKQ
mgnify:CR=1 FL=1|jgi:hypothetical protein